MHVAPLNCYRDGAPQPLGFFWLFAIGELVSKEHCAIIAASWWVSGDGQCRDATAAWQCFVWLVVADRMHLAPRQQMKSTSQVSSKSPKIGY